MNRSPAEIRKHLYEATQGLLDRQSLVDTILLAAVAREHVLVIGPPGTAKSEVARRMARTLGGAYFEYLLGKFTEPTEIFGTVDLQKLREGRVETDTTGMLPEADIAFLDEIFLGSTAILNTLLGLLNERVFRRGHTTKNVPLRLCIGASNALPTDSALAAFSDRFLATHYVHELENHRLVELLEKGWASTTQQHSPLSISDLDNLSQQVSSVTMANIQRDIANVIRDLRELGVPLSDRRIVRAQKLVAAAAVLDGRSEATTDDLWALAVALQRREHQLLARQHLASVFANARNSTVGSLVEDSSGSIAEITERLRRQATEVLQVQQLETNDTLVHVLREIDASFSDENRPDDLTTLRQLIADRLATEQR